MPAPVTISHDEVEARYGFPKLGNARARRLHYLTKR